MSLRYILILSTFLLLGACASVNTTTVIETKNRSELRQVAIATFFQDALRGWYERGVFQKVERFPATPVDWETNDQIQMVMRGRLEGQGYNVLQLDADKRMFASGAAETEKQNLNKMIAEELSRQVHDPDIQAFIIVTPNAVNFQGMQYSGSRDFLLGGFVGAAVGASTKEESYIPAFILSGPLIEPMHCMLGFDLSVFDAESLEVIGEVRSVLAKQVVPREVWDSNYEAMSAESKKLVREGCLEGLKDAVSQTLSEVGLLQ